MKIASLDIETFCPTDLLSLRDFEYLKSRTNSKEDELILAVNPYVSYIVSASLYYLDSNLCEVFYITDNGVEQDLNLNIHTKNGKKTLQLNYIQ